MRKTLWIVTMLVAALVAVGVVSAASNDKGKDGDDAGKIEETEHKADRDKGKHDARGKHKRYSMAFKARLSGDQEVVADGAPDPSNVETRGKAKFLVSADGSKVKFRMKIRDGKGIFGGAGAHIHCAPAGQNGPVVAWLAGGIPAVEGVDTAFDGTVKVGGMLHDGSIIATDPKADGATCPAAISDIASLVEAAKAGYLYVNVHSFEFPAGVVRGQIEPASHKRACHRAKGKHRKLSTFGKRCAIGKYKRS